jgi:serpin B
MAASLMVASVGCGGGATKNEQSPSSSPAGTPATAGDPTAGDVDSGQVIEELRGTAARAAGVASAPTPASDDTWAFGWKLYAAEAQGAQNVFFSPYSIAETSAMLVAGAGGETKSEIDAALSFTNDDGADFHAARSALAQALAARNHTASADRSAQNLRVSNDLWLEKHYRPAATYLDTLSAYYGSDLSLADFAGQTEAARVAINDRVARETEQLIPELLPPGSLPPNIACVLTNSLYFKANWASTFAPEDTEQDLFVTAGGSNTPVSLMYRTFETDYVASSEYEAIRLPYSGGDFELVAIMPALGTFADFARALTAERVRAISSELANHYTNVALGFPKFSLEYRLPLKDRLQQLGMKLAFEPAADFDEQLGDLVYVADAFHQASIAVDEQGTEAAAATAFAEVALSRPPTPVSVTFDHPFVFFIRDRVTDTLLFVGQLTAP